MSRNTINDWMDKILLDMELLGDPLWQQALPEPQARYLPDVFEEVKGA